jgi:hypothetical protein
MSARKLSAKKHSKASLSEHLFDVENPRRRDVAEETYARATTQGSQLAEELGPEDNGTTLALLNCQVWPVGGDGIESRSVYLPLGAIDSWWIGSQSQIKGHQGGGFFAGVLVPIDGE